eukprot:7950769-Pyramimonas_sp.AAC.1
MLHTRGGTAPAGAARPRRRGGRPPGAARISHTYATPYGRSCYTSVPWGTLYESAEGGTRPASVALLPHSKGRRRDTYVTLMTRGRRCGRTRTRRRWWL